MLVTVRVRVQRHEVFQPIVALIAVDVVNVPAIGDRAMHRFPLGTVQELVALVAAGPEVAVSLLVEPNAVERLVLALRLAADSPSPLRAAGSATPSGLPDGRMAFDAVVTLCPFHDISISSV